MREDWGGRKNTDKVRRGGAKGRGRGGGEESGRRGAGEEEGRRGDGGAAAADK